MSNLAKTEPKISTTLTSVNDTYMPLVMAQMENIDVQFSPYAKQCTLHAISAIHNVLDKAGLKWNSPELDKSTISDMLIKIACLQLNAAASPREVYFQLRRVKGADGTWKRQVEMGIEGDGNDALLARFGRDVADIGQIWKVREKDTFKYPHFTGLDMSPPEWVPKGEGKLVRIVYPVIKNQSDGKRYAEFYISEREDVLKNLIAHINSNMMNETFGIAESKFKANAKQKAEIDQRKKALLKKANSLGLEAALDDEELQAWISPAWTDYHSREAMIERKMRNNAIKKIPKDFANGAMETMFEETTNNVFRQVKEEVTKNQASLPMEIEDIPEAPVEVEVKVAEEPKEEKKTEPPQPVDFDFLDEPEF